METKRVISPDGKTCKTTVVYYGKVNPPIWDVPKGYKRLWLDYKEEAIYEGTRTEYTYVDTIVFQEPPKKIKWREFI